jgi:NSS family neurotransmitter:Na+ symporter
MSEQRERWGGRLPFIMAAIGSAVGLGNVWRFPATAYGNGGGAFLIPYLVALVTAGIPLLIVEFALGQKYQLGAPGSLGRINRQFRWVGWFALLVAGVITFYYVAIMAWAWHYSVASVTLEWTKPAPARIEQPVDDDGRVRSLDQRIVPRDRVVLYLEYKTAEHKRRLRDVIEARGSGGEKPLLLSSAELEERKAVEAQKPENERRHYVSLDANAGNYFFERCLGGFADGQWRAIAAHNEAMKERIERLEELKKRAGEFGPLSAEEQAEALHDLRERLDDARRKLAGMTASADAPPAPAEPAGDVARLRADVDALSEELAVLMQAADPGTHRTVVSGLDEQIAAARQKRHDFRSELFGFSPWTAMWVLVTWGLIFLIIFKGVHVVGKVVTWTVSLPLVLLAILLVRGVTLNGATEGILYYLTPSWDKLQNADVWLAAYGQVFFSLTLGFGVQIAYASYKPRESDITNNAFITAFANCSTSFFAAFAVFSVLGYLAQVNDQPVGDVVKGGPGLVFVTYPIAIAKIGGIWGSIIGMMFFFCLLLLGIDSAFSLVEGAVTGLRDRYTRLNKTVATLAFCIVGCGVSLFFTMPSGLMWLDIVDNWMSNYGLVLVGLLQCVAVGYFFRHHEIEEFVNDRSEIHLGGWFELFIKYITPGVLVFLLAKRFIGDMTATYGGYDLVLENAVTYAGWGVFVVLLAVALVLGRNWTKAIWLGSMLVVFGVFRLWFGAAAAAAADPSRASQAAAMGAFGLVLLFGGFFTCLRLALRNKGETATIIVDAEKRKGLQ